MSCVEQAENCLAVFHPGQQNHQGHVSGDNVEIRFGYVVVQCLEIGIAGVIEALTFLALTMSRCTWQMSMVVSRSHTLSLKSSRSTNV